MASHLYIHIAEPSGPIREQMPGQTLMPQAQPFRINDNLFRRGLKDLVIDRDEPNGKPFGQF